MSPHAPKPKTNPTSADSPVVASITNGLIRVEYLTTGGPRITGLYLLNPDSSTPETGNLLAEKLGIQWDTPYGPYSFSGGHRLWIAPENPAFTAIPDNSGLVVKTISDPSRISLIQPANALTPIQRSMCIRLHVNHPAVSVEHELKNDGSETAKLSPWAITQFPMGGLAVLPHDASGIDPHNLQPNRNLVLWPYTHLDDPRLRVSDQGCLLYANSMPTPCKIGAFNRLGWLAYFRKGNLFIKRFLTYTEKTGSTDELSPNELVSSFPDLGCNSETYVKDKFIELESLGPVVPVEPGESITHVEEWLAYTGFETPNDISAAFSIVTTLLSQSE
jgi:hypothetical protein